MTDTAALTAPCEKKLIRKHMETKFSVSRGGLLVAAAHVAGGGGCCQQSALSARNVI